MTSLQEPAAGGSKSLKFVDKNPLQPWREAAPTASKGMVRTDSTVCNKVRFSVM